jgi:peptidoglycan hydrolase-like protein with peptidoglycan-binding domain
VLGFRRLLDVTMTGVPSANPNLKLGSRGEQVAQLQSVLGELGYHCGAHDGIFGKRTEGQLIAFQRDEGLEPDGIYNANVKAKIDSIFQS